MKHCKSYKDVSCETVVSRWRDMKEELPKEGKSVLIVISQLQGNIEIVKCWDNLEKEKYEQQLEDAYGKENGECPVITHWMPLPEPPSC